MNAAVTLPTLATVAPPTASLPPALRTLVARLLSADRRRRAGAFARRVRAPRFTPGEGNGFLEHLRQQASEDELCWRPGN